MIEIIAEIGINHQGDVAQAVKLIDAAKACGCNTVKFQTWCSERVYIGDDVARMKKLELSHENLIYLKNYCKDTGIEFLCTPDDIDDAIFLHRIGVKRIKTSSAAITNLLLLRFIGKLGLPVLMSTGACTWNELIRAHSTLRTQRTDITVLHCVSAYPAPVSEANMAMITMLQAISSSIGFSDHTIGVTAAMLGLALGAKVFEKHLTLDCSAEGPDHKASANPTTMMAYVHMLRSAEKAMGDGYKRVMPCEIKNRERYDDFVRRQNENSSTVR